MDTVEKGVLHDQRSDAGLGRQSSENTQDEKRSKQSNNNDVDIEAGPKPHDDGAPPPPFKALSFLDKFLVLWILLAMALGIILANLVPSTGPALQRGEFVGVSIPIAIGLLVMMYPILCKVRYETLHLLLKERMLWKQIGISFFLNWIIAPLFMTGLAWAFLPDRQELRDGLIFVGVARCIAMVLIWTDLAGGDGDYCAVLVAFNSNLQIVLFAPMAVFYVTVVSHDPAPGTNDSGSDLYSDVATSVAAYLGIPLGAAVITRLVLRRILGERNYQLYFIRFIAPWSLIGLLYTIVVLFGSQGLHVVQQITSVLRVCAPLVVYFLVIFPLTAWMMWKSGFGYKVSSTQSFTAASNNFELAIAVVVSVYGAGSQEALAATVGPLIEVPVLIALVYVIKWCRKHWQWKD
ncbi:Arsenical-resistance protein Acr3 [Pseudocercospora fuligena]|uniref:Arsenical-resistance protein Acr3 n=1 Tax=Pseudocercospora fuligena TaxID=685502 RepID=A0A8H6RBD0_9PEZI|nr:Arsenical-resistance protein Acr3 [Pseudocercospora fuligena]